MACCQVSLSLTASKMPSATAEELQRLGWGESDLVARRKNDPGKMAIAVRLRRETPLSTKAIAGRVHLCPTVLAEGFGK